MNPVNGVPVTDLKQLGGSEAIASIAQNLNKAVTISSIPSHLDSQLRRGFLKEIVSQLSSGSKEGQYIFITILIASFDTLPSRTRDKRFIVAHLLHYLYLPLEGFLSQPFVNECRMSSPDSRSYPEYS